MLETTRRWLFYLKVAWLDIFRLRTSVVLHTIIVTGICLPILLLLGLKRGHIAELRHDLVTSPTGRQIVVSVSGRSGMLTPENIPRLESDLGPVDVIVPDKERVADLSRTVASQTPLAVKGVTLRSTLAGDPILAVHDADCLTRGESAIVLFKSVADTLNASVGENVTVTVTRRAGTTMESSSTDLEVKAIIPTESNERIGYAHIDVIDAIERYVRGGRVPQYGWLPAKGAVRDRYAEYLLFCETTDNLTLDDITAFEARGFSIEEVVDEDLRLLYGILKFEALEKLILYRVFTEQSRSDPANRLAMSPFDVASISAADDLVIPWNGPRSYGLGEIRRLIIGFSLPRRTWLKVYMHNSNMACPYLYEQTPVILPFEEQPKSSVTLSFNQGKSLTLHPVAASNNWNSDQIEPVEQADGGIDTVLKQSIALVPDSIRAYFKDSIKQMIVLAPIPIRICLESYINGESEMKLNEMPVGQQVGSGIENVLEPQIAVVPVQVLAYLDAYENGRAEFDPDSEQFIPTPAPPTYTQARLYAKTIDDVLVVIKELQSRNFAYSAQNARIKEIQGQDRQLEELVYIVGAGVFLFGIFTVFSILLEATERKRGTIGILRVMGISRPGIFLIVFVRAIVVGLLAGLLTWGLGIGIAKLLAWHPDDKSIQKFFPQVTAILDRNDVVLILAGATLCCLVGSIFPAWRASQRDPFDAISEGRFR